MIRMDAEKKSLKWLVATQVSGAFNDNLFKLLAIFQLLSIQGRDAVIQISALTGLVFVAPFILLAPVAGYLADRYSKQKIIQALKTGEIAIMSAGVVFLWMQSTIGLYATIFLMSAQSALMGPAKKGILPEMVSGSKLTSANSILVSGTYLAIIFGTASAAAVSTLAGGFVPAAASVCVLVAVTGAVCSRYVRNTGNGKSTAQGVSLKGSLMAVQSAFRDRLLAFSLLAAAVFMFLGAFLQMAIIPYGIEVLSLSRESAGYLFLLAALGIGAGAFFVGRISSGVPQLGLIPVGAFGITGFTYALTHVDSVAWAAILMLALGFFAGLLVVPVNTLIQMRSIRRLRGRVLAVSEVLNFGAVLLASGALAGLGALHIPIQEGLILMVIVGGLLFLGATLTLVPWVLRLLPAAAARVLYRFHTRGQDNVPAEGPALLVFNHTSWADAVLAVAASPRPVRFLMERRLYNKWFLYPIVRLAGVIPVSYGDGPHALRRSLEEARKVLHKGEVVGIFPEGAISPHGYMLRFRGGYRKIVENTGASVIPVHIDGAWGSCLSYYGGKLFSRFPRWRRRIVFTFGRPVENTVQPARLRSVLEELGAESRIDHKELRTLPTAFITTARKQWLRPALRDSSGKNIRFGEALIGTIALSRLLESVCGTEKHVGVLLPASVGGALANTALSFSGKVPVNINFTASDSAVDAAVRQCGIRTIVTARAFMEKSERKEFNARLVYLEDLGKMITRGAKMRAAIEALLVPAKSICKIGACCPEDPATVLFSSGSTADPKGIVLSHKNVLSNIDSVGQGIAISHSDRICAALPFFHSFGYTATLWFPLVKGFGAAYSPNPFDGATVAQMTRRSRATILLATPTFLRTYIRRAKPEDFHSLRLVVVGAEKLRPDLADAFEKRFGIRPLEGYGATELAPVAGLNVPDVAVKSRTFSGNRSGTIGRVLPGIAARIVDVDSGEDLPTGKEGLLLVKGANVMMGYFEKSTETQRVIRDGWYVTGDIARLDDEGFISLTDRLSRFSKIAGEMVPHGAVESAILDSIGTEDPVVAVTSIDDSVKGERLVVLYCPEAGSEEALKEAVRQSDMPNLWKPGENAWVPVNEIPVLGSGKVDLKALKRIAREWHEYPIRAAA